MIETERMILRPQVLEDFEAAYAITAQEAVYRYLGGEPITRSVKWEKFTRGPAWWLWLGYGFWAIDDRATGRLVGEIGFGEFMRPIDPPLPDMPEMGWILDPTVHGRGFASEALTAILAWAEAQMPQTPFQCIIDPDNDASLALAAKFGFREVRRSPYGPDRDAIVILERAAR